MRNSARRCWRTTRRHPVKTATPETLTTRRRLRTESCPFLSSGNRHSGRSRQCSCQISNHRMQGSRNCTCLGRWCSQTGRPQSTRGRVSRAAAFSGASHTTPATVATSRTGVSHFVAGYVPPFLASSSSWRGLAEELMGWRGRGPLPQTKSCGNFGLRQPRPSARLRAQRPAAAQPGQANAAAPPACRSEPPAFQEGGGATLKRPSRPKKLEWATQNVSG
jgi:hypothetical protein